MGHGVHVACTNKSAYYVHREFLQRDDDDDDDDSVNTWVLSILACYTT